MAKVSEVLRSTDSGYALWCPGCEEMHVLPSSWKFNGNLESPSYTPSFKHEGIQRIFVNGKWTGEWRRDTGGNTIPYVCHYVLTDGRLNFCGDCTHPLANRSVPIPPLPDGYDE